jgi:hypothetical protein
LPQPELGLDPGVGEFRHPGPLLINGLASGFGILALKAATIAESSVPTGERKRFLRSFKKLQVRRTNQHAM